MQTILKSVYLAVILLMAVNTAHAERWGSFKRDQCVSDSHRQYSAVLHDIPWGKSWEKACSNNGATINGKAFSKPTRCVNSGTQMWGEFEVPDESCAPKWGSWRKEGCYAFTQATGNNLEGYRRYASVLWNVRDAGRFQKKYVWVASCKAAKVALKADGKSYHFDSPHVCAIQDSRGITYGVGTGVLLIGTAAAAVLTGGPGGLVGPAAAPFVYMAAEGVGEAAPLNVWGNVYIPDQSCHINNSEVIQMPGGLE